MLITGLRNFNEIFTNRYISFRCSRGGNDVLSEVLTIATNDKEHENLKSSTSSNDRLKLVLRQRRLSNRNTYTRPLISKKKCEIETFKCTQCSYVTKYKSNLTRHFSTHINIKKSKEFQNEIDKHNLIYQNFSTFKCTECSYQTKLRKWLEKHIEEHKISSKAPN